MLTFENIVLVLSSIMLILGLARGSNPIYTILAVIAIYLLHFILGSPRWQFLPLYAVVFFTSSSILFDFKHVQHRRALIALGMVCVVLSQVFNYLLPIFSLPKTNGDYKISATAYNLDNNLKYKIWFPISTIPQTDGKTCYYDNPHTKSIMGMPKFLFGHLKHVETNALEKGGVTNQKFPLIIYSHGASSIMVDNTALLEEISSQGYVVVAIQHDFNFEKYGIDINDAKKVDTAIQVKVMDNLVSKAVPEQVIDYKKLLVSLQKLPHAKNIDFKNIGLIGHSLGGTTVTSVPTIIEHVKAVVNIDGPISKKIIPKYETSFLYISSFSPNLSDAQLQEFNVPPSFYRSVKNYELQNVKDFFETNSINTSWVRFKTANHLDLTDMPFVIPFLASRNYDKYKGHQLKSKIIVSFLNHNLKDNSRIDHIENKTIEWIKNNHMETISIDSL